MYQNNSSQFAPLTVLLVDDDPALRSAIGSMLGMLGFQTLIVNHGIQAIQLVLAESPVFHLAISDFKMPHLNGMETLNVLRALRPGLKSILCSGHTEQECFQGLTIEDCVYLGKPFRIQDLAAAVNLALGYPATR